VTSFFSLFPLLFLSGSVTPLESMPRWLQIGIEGSPLRHSIAITSGLFLKGAELPELWPHSSPVLVERRVTQEDLMIARHVLSVVRA